MLKYFKSLNYFALLSHRLYFRCQFELRTNVYNQMILPNQSSSRSLQSCVFKWIVMNYRLVLDCKAHYTTFNRVEKEVVSSHYLTMLFRSSNWRLQSFEFLISQKMFMSSAYRRQLLRITFVRSFTKILNNNRPKLLPWRTPKLAMKFNLKPKCVIYFFLPSK